MNDHPTPKEIILHKESRTLEIVFSNDNKTQLSWEYLRVFSPSMEVRARHGKDRLHISGKQDVILERIEPIGRYAIKLYFNDGHHTGLYDWRYLWELAENKAVNWKDYLDREKAEISKP